MPLQHPLLALAGKTLRGSDDKMRGKAAIHLVSAWAIENSYHRVLDVTFGGDYSRIRDGESSENMATLRAIALNLLKRATGKSSLGQKRFRAAMGNDFLLQLLRPI